MATPSASAASPHMSPFATSAALRDQDIIDLLHAARHAEAYELIAERYEDKVYRLCVAMLREPVAAQDAAQESLIRVWKALSSYDGRAALSTWIYAITRNRCLSALARPIETLSLSDEAIEAEANGLAAPTGDQDSAALIRQLVAQLPETPRQVITLYYFEDRSVSEVARMLACPEGTVKTHLHRARANLLARLTELGLAEAKRRSA